MVKMVGPPKEPAIEEVSIIGVIPLETFEGRDVSICWPCSPPAAPSKFGPSPPAPPGVISRTA